MVKYNLIVTSWVGSLPGAEHFYGTIERRDRKTYTTVEEIKIVATLTSAMAKKLNLDAKRRGDDMAFKWKKGDDCGQFFKESDLFAAAIEALKDKPDAVLFVGSPSVCDPMPVIHGPESFKLAANALVAEAEANDWWEGDEPRMKDISRRWEALLREHELWT